MAQATSAEATGAEGRRAGRASTYALFAIVVLGASCGALAQTSVNAMMTDIMLTYGLSVELGQWLTTSYMLVLGITVPAATWLSRRFSLRAHVLIAFAFFLVGDVACLIAPNFGVLLAGRILQAISTGLTMPLIQVIAMTEFPHGRQATAMGIAGIAMGFAPNIGPTIGGAMSFSLGWRSFFLLLLALMALITVAAVVCIRRGGAPDEHARLEVVSLLFSTLGFGGVLLGFSNASGFAPTSPFVWVPIVVGVVFLVLFVRRQKRIDEPLISMDVFASRQFGAGLVAQSLLFTSFMGITLVVPLYVEGACGGTSLDAGMVLLPGTVAALVLNPLSGMLTDRMGARRVAIVAGASLAIGATLMAFMDETTPLGVMMAYQAVRAMGVSGLVGPLTSWSLEKLPEQLMADGSSLGIAVRQACASFGTSAMVLIVDVVGAGALGSVAPALPYQLAFGFSALVGVSLFAFIVWKVR